MYTHSSIIHTYTVHTPHRDRSKDVYTVETGVSLIRGQSKKAHNHNDLEAHKFLVNATVHENRIPVPFLDFEILR
jgi:hypothetical protein